MAINYKVLGQINPTSNTSTTLYTVPASTSAVLSTITVCNQASTSATFRLAVRPAGIALEAKHFVNYNKRSTTTSTTKDQQQQQQQHHSPRSS